MAQSLIRPVRGLYSLHDDNMGFPSLFLTFYTHGLTLLSFDTSGVTGSVSRLERVKSLRDGISESRL